MHIESWVDEMGTTWEVVSFAMDEDSEGSFIIRERNVLDYLDGDSNEGFTIIARYNSRSAAESFLNEEGFVRTSS